MGSREGYGSGSGIAGKSEGRGGGEGVVLEKHVRRSEKN